MVTPKPKNFKCSFPDFLASIHSKSIKFYHYWLKQVVFFEIGLSNEWSGKVVQRWINCSFLGVYFVDNSHSLLQNIFLSRPWFILPCSPPRPALSGWENSTWVTVFLEKGPQCSFRWCIELFPRLFSTTQ